VLRLHPTCYLNYDGCTITATEDDHIIPVAEGGTDHISNHAGACAHCHRIKSKREAAHGNRRAAAAR
jgi:5-methylcytosine-specific restriction endonuclease McrA